MSKLKIVSISHPSGRPAAKAKTERVPAKNARSRRSPGLESPLHVVAKQPLPGSMSPMATDEVLAEILSGLPVLIGERLMIARASECRSTIKGDGVVLFGKIETFGDLINGEVTDYMSLPALALAVETGFARVVTDRSSEESA